MTIIFGHDIWADSLLPAGMRCSRSWSDVTESSCLTANRIRPGFYGSSLDEHGRGARAVRSLLMYTPPLGAIGNG
jgi:hypothetical protein